MATMFAACSSDKKDYDATGAFETTEVTVAAEQTGRIMDFDITEGQNIDCGKQVGVIDTVQLQLKAMQMGVARETYENQKHYCRPAACGNTAFAGANARHEPSFRQGSKNG